MNERQYLLNYIVFSYAKEGVNTRQYVLTVAQNMLPEEAFDI